MRKTKKDVAKLKAELAALKAMPDEDIDTSDIPEVTDWHAAVRGQFYRPVKKAISLRVDADVLAWFRSLGSKYQSRMNEALREYMRRHRKQAAAPHPDQ
jgi:uncharacterized protein (DUF4415 family)